MPVKPHLSNRNEAVKKQSPNGAHLLDILDGAIVPLRIFRDKLIDEPTKSSYELSLELTHVINCMRASKELIAPLIYK